MTLICAKFEADLINISKVTSRKTKWPRFFGLPGTSVLNQILRASRSFLRHTFTLRAKLSGAVYCYRSRLWRAGGVCVFVGLLP